MKAIQATFYSNANATRNLLTAHGFDFIERPVLNVFYGTEFTVIVPSGKGKNKKVDLINQILGKGINIYLTPKQFHCAFPNYRSLPSYNAKIGA
jgi:hypothetical protein